MEDYLSHVGTPHDGMIPHSGRFEYGSGKEPYQHADDFLSVVEKFRHEGMSETEIAEQLGMSTTELRKRKTIEREARKAAEYSRIIALKEKGYSNVAIGQEIGRNDTYVGNMLRTYEQNQERKASVTASILKDSVDSNGYIDIGPGTETMLGVTRTKMSAAVRKLEDEGYVRLYPQAPQATDPNKKTTIQVLAKPGTTYKDVYDNIDKIAFPMENKNIAKLREEGGDVSLTLLGIQRPTSVDSNRVQIRYAEDGGKDMDGVIELRRGAKDLSMGGANYAQVRILVDDSKYLKGMAVYSDDLPDGIDIRFNTNKTKDVPKMEVLKSVKKNRDGSVNWENPFGTTLDIKDGVVVGQRNYIDDDGKSKLSPINIVRAEGEWDTWSKTLASQFLSKQPMQLINQQLNKSYAEKKEEFDEINKLTNPEVKKLLLEQFADDCDSSSVHLKAASLPRQASKVILPLPDISDKEVYAPTFENGEEVILIRYPHGGTFEIPRLTVNNKLKSGKKTLGTTAVDAIGINSKVAEKLSGADFDGDTVVVIPTKGQKFRVKPTLAGLANFDPKEQYGPKSYEGTKIKILSEKGKQNEMGKISNLITDMTLKGATDDELARAVRHSMVVIDAVKHELNYQQSAKDNRINELKKKYQGSASTGSATLISRAKGTVEIDDRKEVLSKSQMSSKQLKDYNEGKKIYESKGNGKTIKITKMEATDDAYTLSSGTPQENAYANYANKLKALANAARKEYRTTKSIPYNPEVKKAYAEEVASLNDKYKVAIANKPYERRAQAMASKTVSIILKDNPDIWGDKDELKKVRTQALVAARAKAGTTKRSERVIKITDREWEAIQAGAFSPTRASEILRNANPDQIKNLATPYGNRELTTGQLSRIRTLKNSGRTISEIASLTGLSTSTVSKHLND